MTKTNVSKLNKKGLAFAAVVLLLAAAIFVGAAAGEGGPTGGSLDIGTNSVAVYQGDTPIEKPYFTTMISMPVQQEFLRILCN